MFFNGQKKFNDFINILNTMIVCSLLQKVATVQKLILGALFRFSSAIRNNGQV